MNADNNHIYRDSRKRKSKVSKKLNQLEKVSREISPTNIIKKLGSGTWGTAFLIEGNKVLKLHFLTLNSSQQQNNNI